MFEISLKHKISIGTRHFPVPPSLRPLVADLGSVGGAMAECQRRRRGGVSPLLTKGVSQIFF